MQDIDQNIIHLHKGSVLIPPGKNRFYYRRRINSRYHYKSLKTDNFDTAYKRGLDYEKMNNIEFINALKFNLGSQNFITFSDACNLFREHKADGPKSTAISNCSRFKILESRLGTIPMEAISTFVVERTLKTIKKDRGLKNATVNRYRDLISAVFTFLKKRNLYPGENPVSIIPRPSEELEKPQKKVFTRDEKRLIYEKSNGWLRVFAVLGFEFGMRKTEILSIEKSRVLIDTREIVFDSFKQRDRRRLPVNELCFEILKPYYLSLPNNTKWLFPDSANPSNRITNPYEKWKNMLKYLNIPYKSIKIMRDTFITHSLEDNIPKAIIRLYTGHKSDKVFDSYSHVGQDYELVRKYMNREFR